MKYIYITILIILAIVFLRRVFPFMFWNKKNLGDEKFATWIDIFNGKIINHKKLKNAKLSVPQCKKCFLSSFKRNDLSPNTIIDPIYADYNVVGVKVNNKVIFICKKHKIQIEERDYMK